MRFVRRLALDSDSHQYLAKRQADVDKMTASGNPVPEGHWKSSQKANKMGVVRKALKEMTGPSVRCMYCMDSHGSDIEHFWPKKPFPTRMYLWANLLLCCASCQRHKGDRFALKDGKPMLVDPTVDDPWAHLDFDPQTGKLTARFILAQNMASERGIETVAALHFDFREELHSQYRKSWKRLTKVAMEFLKSNSLDAKSLVRELNEADDHGLLGWCVHGAGLNEAPFDSLWKAAPDAFEKLSAAH